VQVPSFTLGNLYNGGIDKISEKSAGIYSSKEAF
jgi:hypothetical protein